MHGGGEDRAGGKNLRGFPVAAAVTAGSFLKCVLYLYL
jgi:hypothetical protein